MNHAYALLSLAVLVGCGDLLGLDEFGTEPPTTVASSGTESTTAGSGATAGSGGVAGADGASGGAGNTCLSCAECLTTDPPCSANNSWISDPCGRHQKSSKCEPDSSCSHFMALQTVMCSDGTGGGGSGGAAGCYNDCYWTCEGQEPASLDCINCLETQFDAEYDACASDN